MFRLSAPLFALGLVLLTGASHAQGVGKPIIDMHLHAVAVNSQGPPPVAICTPVPFPTWDPQKPYAELFGKMTKQPPCDNPVWSPATDDQLFQDTLAALRKYNVIGVTSGTADRVLRYKEAAPDRIFSGLLLGGPNAGSPTSIEQMRALHKEHRLDVIGELTTQYVGISPDDPRLEPMWSLAKELDVPVGIHLGTGPPGAPYLGSSGYRARLHSALTLEEVLMKHRGLRVYIMHAGWPMGDDLLALLYAHPHVYVDVAVIDWMLPRQEFYRYLQRIVEAGFGNRVMYGSDQMVWPGTIERSIAVIEDAPFLNAEQKRDIFYNNAARFLRLSNETIAMHHNR